MYCINCGKKILSAGKYCSNCGSEIVKSEEVVGEIVNTPEIVDNSKLSIASLICLIIRILTFTGSIYLNFGDNNILMDIPWLFASLILAIISRKKYKDKLAKVMLIIDAILMVLEIIIVIIGLVMLLLITIGVIGVAPSIIETVRGIISIG